MDFWDRQKQELMGTSRASDAHSFEWSADSRYCLTATTFPRLRVDNGLQVWKHNGDKVHEESFGELYTVAWRPGVTADYPNLKPDPKEQESTSSSSSSGAKFQAYRPPGARASNWSSNFMKQDDDGTAKEIGSKKSIPGAEKLSRTALKNKRKREKKKQAREAQSAREELQNTIASKESSSSNSNENENKPKPLDTIVACEKKLKNLNKKLRQINTLKQKFEQGESLEGDQLIKISRESEVKDQIAEVEALKEELNNK
eukprot:TRINITY_DN3493_c0_g1_i3.p2 TRINITY_DN3493_c0_g1~~TRINITY_DN3493_c0_g1_i3.p2  ORF type:complete len:258 (+),score=96.48 TRINITY_DN3493_c0_g1_i3:1220-1993(+)